MNLKRDLDEYFMSLEKEELFSGVVLITQGESCLYRGAFGYASRPWKVNNAMHTRFDTASITKLFTAVAALQLIDRGQFDFETQVIDFLGLKGTAISKEVNVFHLLTHTSGIGDDSEEEDGEVYEDLWKTVPNYSVTTTADFLPQFIYKPANFPPGKGCRYCNCGYVLLGLMIEKVSGIPYRDYVRQNVFAKAQMPHSDFLRMDRVHEDIAEGIDPLRDEHGSLTGWKKNIYSFPPIGSPDSGAFVTASDLDAFLRSVEAGEQLSSELTAAFFSPQVLYRVKDNWTMMNGYGLWFYVDKSDNIVCYQKEGINAGVSGLIRRYPALDVNVVLLSNLEDGVWQPIREIHDLLISGEGNK